MFKKFPRPLLAALFIFANARAAIPPAENLLPSDTMLVVTVPDFTALRADAKQSPQWLFWNDPAMKPFHDHFIGKLDDALISPLENDLGVKIADFENLPQGQLTFAVTQNGWDGKAGDKSPGFVFLLDAKEKSGLLKTNLAALQKKWTDDGKNIRTETIRGLSFSVVTLASNDVPAALTNLIPRRPRTQELGQTPAPEKPQQLVVGQFQSLLIAGNSVEAVAPVVAHLTGSAMPALSDNAAFAADSLAHFRSRPLYYGWFNAKIFFGILASIPPPEPNPEAPTVFPATQWDKIISALGLTAVNSASFIYRDSHEGAQVDFYIAAPDSERQGIFKMLAPEAKTAMPPAFVPANVTKFWRSRVDGQQAWQTLQNIINGISPSGMIGINAMLDMANANAQQKNPGFDIRNDLFGNLGDDFISYQKTPNGSTLEDANNAPALFLFGVQNGDRAIAAINMVATMMPSAQKIPDPRDLQGHKIYSIPLPNPRVRGAAAAPQRFLYCANSGGYVALTTDVSILEEYLRSAGSPPAPLSSMPGLLDAAQQVGGAGTGFFGYQNQRDVLRPLFKILKDQSAADATAANPFLMFPKELRDWMDFSLLPDYDTVSKYFYFTVYAAAANADGISFKTFAPRPPQLN